MGDCRVILLIVSRLLTGYLLLLVVAAYPSQVLALQNPEPKSSSSDESGTLIIVGRTKDSVMISVDSKISGWDPGRKKDIDGNRKLIAVGHRSACFAF